LLLVLWKILHICFIPYLMKLDICHQDNILFKMSYKSNMLKDITWKLKASVCSSIIAFKNPSSIASLCGFLKYLEFLGLCDHVDSHMAIVLFNCLLASHYWRDASQVHYIILLNQIPWISFSQYKSLNQVQMCMNWKDLEFQVPEEH
jgi:hypothetical protein